MASGSATAAGPAADAADKSEAAAVAVAVAVAGGKRKRKPTQPNQHDAGNTEAAPGSDGVGVRGATQDLGQSAGDPDGITQKGKKGKGGKRASKAGRE